MSYDSRVATSLQRAKPCRIADGTRSLRRVERTRGFVLQRPETLSLCRDCIVVSTPRSRTRTIFPRHIASTRSAMHSTATRSREMLEAAQVPVRLQEIEDRPGPRHPQPGFQGEACHTILWRGPQARRFARPAIRSRRETRTRDDAWGFCRIAPHHVGLAGGGGRWSTVGGCRKKDAQFAPITSSGSDNRPMGLASWVKLQPGQHCRPDRRFRLPGLGPARNRSTTIGSRRGHQRPKA